MLCEALLHDDAVTAIGQVSICQIATAIAGFVVAVACVLAVACFSI